ncbi:hypothetical protein SAMN06298216_0937 [Spirosomataceae bacterium TFI 002]|nr:hypothetical protein SAMN06298216_0937 [Spirosomataceae bacterium TFI 002]
MKTSLSKYKYPIIGVLILIVLFLLFRSCIEQKTEPVPVPEPETAFYHAIDIPLFAQKGEKSCWAATISMIDSAENFVFNANNTPPIWSDSLVVLLKDGSRKTPLQHITLKKSSDLSWDKFKNVLEQNKPMVAYKYFNITQNYKNAHVFVVKGFQEINNSKWVIVNDPWPVNYGKISAIALNNFTRPKVDAINYTEIEYNYTSNVQDVRTESDFSIFSTQDISDSKPTIYTPDLERINLGKNKRIKPKDIESLLSRQLVLLQQSNPELYKKLKIDYRPSEDVLSIDMKSFLNVKEFSTVAKFLDYDLSASKDNDYLFDGDRLVFVNANKNNEPDISLTVQLEERTANPFLYVSRFESYKYSFKKDWDIIVNDVGIALENPSIRNFLFNLSQVSARNKIDLKYDWKSMPNKFAKAGLAFTSLSDSEEAFDQGQPYDVAMLPLYGGPIYSFTLEGYDEKIVADPYHQLNFRNDRKALFIGASGTPYYRLSSIVIPKTYEFVNRERRKEEEWWPKEDGGSDRPSNPNLGGGTVNPFPKPVPEIGDPVVINPDLGNESDLPKDPDNPIKPPVDISVPRVVLEKIFGSKGVIKVLDYEAKYDGKSISIDIDPISKETVGETKIKSLTKDALSKIGQRIYGNDEETKRRIKLVISSAPIVITTNKESPILDQAKQKVNKLFDRFTSPKDPR